MVRSCGLLKTFEYYVVILSYRNEGALTDVVTGSLFAGPETGLMI